MFSDPHLLERNFFVDVPHTNAGPVRVLGSAMRFSETPTRIDRAGPLLGEHTSEDAARARNDGRGDGRRLPERGRGRPVDSLVNAEILTERRGPVLWIRINRPEARNAMKAAMYDRLVGICGEINADDELRAVVLTGVGEAAFIAGSDIAELENITTGDATVAHARKLDTIMTAVENVRIPIIAAIRGACTGGGMSIATACDLRIATPSARFGFPVARTLGNCLSIANYARLVDIVGATMVKEMVYLAKLIDAQRAYELNYVTEIVAEYALLDRAAEMAATIAGNAPLTIRATKEALRRLAYEGRNADDRDLILSCYTSNDFREGMTAFFEKRPARWTGK